MIRRDINGCSGDSASGRTCYGYVRLCKNAAATQSQREDVAAFARSNGLSLDEWIFDDDGAPLPDFKLGDVLIVSKLFRLGRDIAAVMALLARLLESGATVYSAGDGENAKKTLSGIEPEKLTQTQKNIYNKIIGE